MDLLPQTLVLGGILAIAFSYQLWKVAAKKGKNRIKEAPEPAGAWPVIGHLHLLGGPWPLFKTLGAMADKYGAAFCLRLGLRRTLVVSSWELAKECFTTNDLAFSNKPSKYAAAEHLGYNYAMFRFSPYGPYWREVRKIATQELLSNRRLESLKHVRCSEVDTCVRELYDLWMENRREPVKVEMTKWFGDLAFNVVVRMVAGKRYFGRTGGNDEEAQRFRKTITEFFYLFGVFVVSDALPFLKWLDVKGYESAMKKVAAEIESITEGWIAEHRQKRDSSEYKGDQDFIDVMLSVTGENSQSFSNPDRVIMSTAVVGLLDSFGYFFFFNIYQVSSGTHPCKPYAQPGRTRYRKLLDSQLVSNLQHFHLGYQTQFMLHLFDGGREPFGATKNNCPEALKLELLGCTYVHS